MKQKTFFQVMGYLFVFWLGTKMVILTDKAELSTYFVRNSHSKSNNKQIL